MPSGGLGMTLNKYKFGDLIELNIIKNESCLYGEEDAIGVNIDKVILPMRGSNDSKNYDKFNLVPPKHFAYNPRGSRKLGLGFNDTEKTYIITFNDNVFRIKDSAQNIVLDIYLFMYLSRKEWDRRAEYISWGSSTEVFDWNIFCDEEIELPNLSIQQKYVDIYNSMVANQQAYERGLEDLKLTCDAYIEDLRKQIPPEKIGKYIEPEETTNADLQFSIADVRGVSIEKKFIETKADMEGVSLAPYLLIQPNEFAYVPVTSRNGGKISIALNDSDKTYICSSSYVVFRSRNIEELLPQYLMLFFSRNEFNRYSRFHSWGSAREAFDWDAMCDVQIPIPDIEIQKSIAELYTVYNKRKKINEQLKAQIKNICPILIRGSLEDGGEPNGEPA